MKSTATLVSSALAAVVFYLVLTPSLAVQTHQQAVSLRGTPELAQTLSVQNGDALLDPRFSHETWPTRDMDSTDTFEADFTPEDKALVFSKPEASLLSAQAVEHNSNSKATTPVSHPAYEVLRVEDIKEYGVLITMYRHKKTGAEVMSAVTDDDNKVFGISFRTPPNDSTGVPHILEHSVLCGSKQYPVKEPFVHLLQSSLQTFLNAFTYPDRTVYPVASQNLKDFHNLVNVYLDAVLNPRAVQDPMVLDQEGWHYEIDKPESPLSFKGVVYNEMKGVYGSPMSRVGRTAKMELFPNTTYRFDSGGAPKEIHTLSFKEFQDFYNQHYHPSNSRIFFYGDDPVDQRLSLLDGYLSGYNATKVDQTRVGTQPKWSEPRRVVERFPAQEGKSAAKHIVSVNWLLNEKEMTPTEELAMSLVSHLMMGTAQSTMYKALTESSLGESVIGGGMSNDLKQATFEVGLKGIAKEDVPKVEQFIDETLRKTAKEGFPEDAVNASLNTIEFSMREFNTGSMPRGLAFMLGAVPHWIYERDPMQSLRFEKPLAELKAQLAKKDQRLLEGLVETYLIKNGHKLTVEGVPDSGLGAQEDKAEAAKLNATKSKMSPDELKQAVAFTAKLKAAQEAADSPENIAKLPMLTLADVDRKTKDLDIAIGEKNGVTYLTHKVPSNGIAYVDLAIDLNSLPLDELPLVPLFTKMLLEVGTSKLDETAFSRHMHANTGGVSVSTLNSLKHTADGRVGNLNDGLYRLVIRGKSTAEKTPVLFDVMLSALTDAKLDNQKRAIEILKATKSGMENSFSSSGNSYAQRRIFARRSIAGYIDEMTGGISYFETVKSLLVTAEKDWPSLLQRLEKVRMSVLDKDSTIINLSADEETLKKVDSAVDAFVQKMPKASKAKNAGPTVASHGKESLRLKSENEGFIVPTQVNFVATGGGLFSEGEQVSAAFDVVVRSLSHGYLWDTVRVMGGAYGGQCSLSMVSGTFVCSSYRDPNLAQTLTAFESIADHLESHPPNATDMQPAIIGAIGDLDQPMSPDRKGFVSMVRFLSGETLAARQKKRDEIFATTPADFAAFAKKIRTSVKNWRVSVFGSEAAFSKANTVLAKDSFITAKAIL